MRPDPVKVLLCSLLLLVGTASYAQTDEPNLIPPSPAASAIQRVGIEATNPYTGGADVTIPLFQLKLNELSVPITMKYSGIHGIKVQETASWVGLGWTLSAGGAVSRSIKGLADDLETGYYQTGALPTDMVTQNAQFVDISNGTLDGEPDQFNYSSPGAGGAFFIKKDGSIMQVPMSDNKITFVHSTVSDQFIKFEVTDTRGVVYTYEDIEEVWSHNVATTYPSQLYKASSWYLTKMENANGTETIHFMYELEQPTTYVENYTESFSTQLINGVVTPQYTLTRTKQLKLKKIYDSDSLYVIDFIANTERCDVADTHYLDSVVVKRKGQVLKSFKLDYKYFTTTGSVPLTDPCNPANSLHPTFADGDHEKRLRLDAVTERGSDGGTLPSYTFEYESTKFLPDRNSYARDHWGFYNGVSTNATPEPKQFVYVPQSIYSSEKYLHFGDAVRTPDLASAKAGILSKVNYPTGGYTTFNFELNTTQDSEIESDLSTQTVSQLVTDLETNAWSDSITVDLIERPFTDVRVAIIGFEPTLPSTDPNYCGVKVDAYGPNGFQLTEYFQPEDYDLLNGAQLTLLLPPGDYNLVFTPDNLATCSTGDHTISINWENQVNTPAKEVGGLRIASIENCSETGDCIEKKYRYQNADGSSSGNLVTIPEYGYYVHDGDSGVSSFIIGWTRTVNTNLPLLTTAGNHVGYSRVEEFVENDTLSGRTVYEYASPEYISEVSFRNEQLSSNWRSPEWPQAPTASRDWIRGSIKVREIFEFSNNDFNLLDRNNTVYGVAAEVLTGGLISDVYGDLALTQDSAPLDSIMGIAMSGMETNYYKISTGRIYQKEQISSKYENNKILTTTTENTYLTDYLLSKTTETTFNTGLKQETTYHYNVEDNGSLSTNIISGPELTTLTEMHTNNNIILPFYTLTEDVSDVNNKVTIGQKVTAYRKDGSDYYLDEVRVSQDDTPPELAVEYITYNSKGLPLNYSTRDGMIHSFEWADFQVTVAGTGNEALPSGLTKAMLINGQIENQVTGVHAVTFYEYDNRGRIKTVTDINGKDTSYKYDEFGRLIRVSDHNGKVLKQIDYLFKSPSN